MISRTEMEPPPSSPRSPFGAVWTELKIRAERAEKDLTRLLGRVYKRGSCPRVWAKYKLIY